MAKTELRAWAVKGAEQRLVEIAEEARWIFSAFPELRAPGRGFADDTAAAAPARTAAPKRRRRLSAAARKAVSARMTKYWAARRKARK